MKNKNRELGKVMNNHTSSVPTTLQNVALERRQIIELEKLKIHPREILREVIQRLMDKSYQDTIKKEVQTK